VTTILIFRIGQLGDTLASLPAIRAIRAAHPHARLVLLTDRQADPAAVTSWEVFEPAGLFDDVCYLRVPSRLVDFVRTSREVRRLTPVRLYYLMPMPRTRWQVARDRLFFRWLCGISDIVGLRPPGPYPVRDGLGHLVLLQSEAARLMAWVASELPGTLATDGDWRIHPTPEHRAKPGRLLEGAGFQGQLLVAFAPGSKMQAKKWPEDRFEHVGLALLHCFPDLRLVVVGGPGEKPLGDRLCRAWGDRAINLSGALSVWESAAMLERCALYVGNDTGTMHLAASVATPCVAIFSARDNPGKWEPAGPGHMVLRHDVPCAGCMLETCIDHDLACLKTISVDEVLAAIGGRLQQIRTTACLTSLSSGSAN
jgi:lipopolysaccharide heptosyltransferase III